MRTWSRISSVLFTLLSGIVAAVLIFPVQLEACEVDSIWVVSPELGGEISTNGIVSWEVESEDCIELEYVLRYKKLGDNTYTEVVTTDKLFQFLDEHELEPDTYYTIIIIARDPGSGTNLNVVHHEFRTEDGVDCEPILVFDFPAQGDSFVVSEPINIEWHCLQTDYCEADSFKYDLELGISPSGGWHYIPLESDLTETAYFWSNNTLPIGEYQFRVSVKEGEGAYLYRAIVEFSIVLGSECNAQVHFDSPHSNALVDPNNPLEIEWHYSDEENCNVNEFQYDLSIGPVIDGQVAEWTELLEGSQLDSLIINHGQGQDFELDPDTSYRLRIELKTELSGVLDSEEVDFTTSSNECYVELLEFRGGVQKRRVSTISPVFEWAMQSAGSCEFPIDWVFGLSIREAVEEGEEVNDYLVVEDALVQTADGDNQRYRYLYQDDPIVLEHNRKYDLLLYVYEEGGEPLESIEETFTAITPPSIVDSGMFPTPYNPNSTNPCRLAFLPSLPVSTARLEIIDPHGILVYRKEIQYAPGDDSEGWYVVEWDGSGLAGEPLPYGPYFMKVETEVSGMPLIQVSKIALSPEAAER